MKVVCNRSLWYGYGFNYPGRQLLYKYFDGWLSKSVLWNTVKMCVMILKACDLLL